LRSLAEKKQAFRVGMHTYAVVPLLTDEDPATQRKAAALFRVIAEEGAAPMIARFVPSIMSGFEASQRNGAPLLAPLDAITAIADSGEVAATAQIIDRIMATLQDDRPKIRASTCETLAAIARGGVQRQTLGRMAAHNPLCSSCWLRWHWMILTRPFVWPRPQPCDASQKRTQTKSPTPIVAPCLSSTVSSACWDNAMAK